jgi:arylsulfatase A-like enzyme
LFWRGRRGDVTWRAARDGDLKRIWKQDGNGRESWLFDLRNDPTERTNLLADRADAAARLQKLMVEWEREVAPRR